ncbi:hypothetical protein GCM10007973_16880 [Polymorphobacter multimanifer]|uniref:Uncharacterized protein n=1 Tax=Polymorphobacter multimanifer TaxID=1070431 RepID=A0A841L5J0_9SPHN|nr:hypothetical protein [Polymorphobacter multimanifer]MBB6228169.1 hypothetical protein [Polymorphobacter multimanifer]GGI80978.1 hypothetical protein GCM10007973_16880 [Polymorphobacter multimanifer]
MSRPTTTTATFAAAMALLLGAAAATAQTADPKDKGSDKINDGDRALDTMENIATKPLKDLNLMKKKVPPELEAMMENPYALTGLKTCRQYAAEVTKITEMVGPDVDSAEARADKKKQTPAEFAFGATEAIAGSLIPFAGVIRFVSGAQKRERYAQAAVYAGTVRRSYIKGTARAKGCKV